MLLLIYLILIAFQANLMIFFIHELIMNLIMNVIF